LKFSEARIQKVEQQVNAIFNPIKWISVIRYQGETEADAIRLAGYPEYEKNRGVVFNRFVVSIDKTTKNITYTKRPAFEHGQQNGHTNCF